MLASEDEVRQVLADLGLTLSQARVYFTLFQSGVSTVRTISKTSKVAREHIYEVLPQLQDLGLVEKIIGIPSEFRALPIKEGLSLLFQRRKRKTHELQEQTMEIIRSCAKENFETSSREEDSQFILIPKRKAAINRRKKEIEATQKSIDSIISSKRLEPTAYTYYEVAKKALERGVKIRAITEKPENENALPEVIQDLKKNPSFKLKYILHPPSAILTIYDKKEMLVTTSPKTGLGESPALWTNNPSILAVINDFFEISWITAMATPRYSLDEEHV